MGNGAGEKTQLFSLQKTAKAGPVVTLCSFGAGKDQAHYGEPARKTKRL